MAGYQNSPRGAAAPSVTGERWVRANLSLGDTGFACQGTADFIPGISAASSSSCHQLGALGRKENQESSSPGTHASLDKSHLADGDSGGPALLGDTRPLPAELGQPSLSAPVMWELLGRNPPFQRGSSRCRAPEGLLLAQSTAVAPGAPGVSDSKQASRAIALQRGRACSAALLPHQCSAQSEEAPREGRGDLSQDPKSRLQITVIRVVVPAGSLG